jgi:hypothetical protein
MTENEILIKLSMEVRNYVALLFKNKIIFKEIQSDLPNKTKSKSTYINLLHTMFAKCFKTFKAIILLCNEGYGQDALCLTRVNLELFYKLKCIAEKPNSRDKFQLVYSYIYSSTKRMLDYNNKELNNPKRNISVSDKLNSIITSQNPNLLKQEEELSVYISKYYGGIVNWDGAQTMAGNIEEWDSYTFSYTPFSFYIHSSVLGLDTYYNSKKTILFNDYDNNDEYVRAAMANALDIFVDVLNVCKNEQDYFKEFRYYKLDEIKNIFQKYNICYDK